MGLKSFLMQDVELVFLLQPSLEITSIIMTTLALIFQMQ